MGVRVAVDSAGGDARPDFQRDDVLPGHGGRATLVPGNQHGHVRLGQQGWDDHRQPVVSHVDRAVARVRPEKGRTGLTGGDRRVHVIALVGDDIAEARKIGGTEAAAGKRHVVCRTARVAPIGISRIVVRGVERVRAPRHRTGGSRGTCPRHRFHERFPGQAARGVDRLEDIRGGRCGGRGQAAGHRQVVRIAPRRHGRVLREHGSL